MSSKILVLPGDGIGVEVADQAIRVIEKLNDKEKYEFLITTVTLSSANLIAKKINLSTGKEANSLDDNARFEYFFD